MEYIEVFHREERDGIFFYSSPLLSSFGVTNAFPERSGGFSTGFYSSLNLSSSTGDDESIVMKNTEKYLSVFSSSPERTVKTRQVHGIRILEAGSAEAPAGAGLLSPIDPCDGLITAEPGLTLLASSADCSLILLYDPVNRLAAALHAGWRGAAADMAGYGVEALLSRGARPGDIVSFLPPAIGPCCFETDEDVPDAMRQGFGKEADPFISQVSPGRYKVDLVGINAHALSRRGLKAEHIEVTRICSCCHEAFYSHRRNGRKRGLSCALIRIPS